jgi:hypothetical protein
VEPSSRRSFCRAARIRTSSTRGISLASRSRRARTGLPACRSAARAPTLARAFLDASPATWWADSGSWRKPPPPTPWRSLIAAPAGRARSGRGPSRAARPSPSLPRRRSPQAVELGSSCLGDARRLTQRGSSPFFARLISRRIKEIESARNSASSEFELDVRASPGDSEPAGGKHRGEHGGAPRVGQPEYAAQCGRRSELRCGPHSYRR